MGAALIADTNIFYNLGSARLKQSDIVSRGEEIHYSPVSVLEIAGKLSDRTFAERKQAAQAILDVGAKQLPDPQSFLTALFGLPLRDGPVDFSHAVKAMAQSANLSQLQAGVPDYAEQVRRQLRFPIACNWRSATETQWVNDILKIMKREIPGFVGWYDPDPRKRSGRVPRLRGEAKRKFLTSTKTREWFAQMVLACQERAFFKADTTQPFNPTRETADRFADAIDKVECYCCMYTQYLIAVLTEGMLPQMNDHGDLELFTYATDDDHVIVTSERRWTALAGKAGFARRVRRVG